LNAIRKVNNHGRIGGLGVPSINPGCPGKQIHGTVRVEPTRQRGASIETIALMIETARAATGVNMSFEDGHIHAGFCEDGGGGEATDAGANHGYTRHFMNTPMTLQEDGFTGLLEGLFGSRPHDIGSSLLNAKQIFVKSIPSEAISYASS
jgi:hypothetical protein